jgi:hypothetical protein
LFNMGATVLHAAASPCSICCLPAIQEEVSVRLVVNKVVVGACPFLYYWPLQVRQRLAARAAVQCGRLPCRLECDVVWPFALNWGLLRGITPIVEAVESTHAVGGIGR